MAQNLSLNRVTPMFVPPPTQRVQQFRPVQLVILVALCWAGWAQADTESLLARGAYLAIAAGCASCHTDKDNDGPAYAGGHRLETPYGDFVAPNITPDAETGIGTWSDAEFVAALRTGVSPAGEHYYPAFPYASYAGMTEADALAIKAYLDSVPAVSRPNEAHTLAWYLPGRWAMRAWQQMFAPWEYAADTSGDSLGDDEGDDAAAWQRGAYLVRHLGHCGECHTPRDSFGALDLTRELAGSPKDSAGGGAPDISATDTGIGSWAEADIMLFLQIGMQPDGDFVGGGMSAVIDNTAELSEDDQWAIARYLLSMQ
jgi:mono/diheme cytochrome c family protein